LKKLSKTVECTDIPGKKTSEFFLDEKMNDDRYKRSSRGGRGGSRSFGGPMKGDFGGGGDGMPMSNYDISRRGGDMTSPPRYMGGGGFGQRSGGMMGGFDRSAKPFTPMRGGGRSSYSSRGPPIGSRRGYPSPRSSMGGPKTRSFGALKYASGSSAYSKGSRSFRPIPGMPSPVGGPSYPSYKPSYKPRGGYNSYNSYNKTNRQQFSEQQLKDRSNISDADWNVCWEFNSKRGCRRGSACKWKHMSFATTDNVCHPVTKEPLNIGGIAGGPAPSTGDAEKTASPEQQQTQEQATTTQEPPKEEASEPSVAAAFAAAVAGRIAAADKAEKACAADKAGKPAPLPKADEPSASVDNKSAPKAEETEEAKNEKAGSGGDAKPDKAGTDGQKVQPIAVE